MNGHSKVHRHLNVVGCNQEEIGEKETGGPWQDGSLKILTGWTNFSSLQITAAACFVLGKMAAFGTMLTLILKAAGVLAGTAPIIVFLLCFFSIHASIVLCILDMILRRRKERKNLDAIEKILADPDARRSLEERMKNDHNRKGGQENG